VPAYVTSHTRWITLSTRPCTSPLLHLGSSILTHVRLIWSAFNVVCGTCPRGVVHIYGLPSASLFCRYFVTARLVPGYTFTMRHTRTFTVVHTRPLVIYRYHLRDRFDRTFCGSHFTFTFPHCRGSFVAVMFDPVAPGSAFTALPIFVITHLLRTAHLSFTHIRAFMPRTFTLLRSGSQHLFAHSFILFTFWISSHHTRAFGSLHVAVAPHGIHFIY